MDFLLNADQSAVLEAVETLLSRHAGPDRLRALGGDQPSYDHELDKRLETAGFLDIAARHSSNRLDAALVQDAISVALGCAATSYRLLVGPSLPEEVEGPFSVVTSSHHGPARFAADAETLIVIGEHEVCIVTPMRGGVDRAVSRLGWPVGHVTDTPAGQPLAGVAPDEVTTWVRIALAVEIAGAMSFAAELTRSYVIERKQFDRAIGSFQAVQHGLAECAVAVEGARWLALEAAYNGTAEAAATALTHAIQASKIVFQRTHQYSGAMGFTEEYDLHLATMRLIALRAEGEALGRPATVSAHQRWALT